MVQSLRLQRTNLSLNSLSLNAMRLTRKTLMDFVELGGLDFRPALFTEACALSRHAAAPLPHASTQCGLGCAASQGVCGGSNTYLQHRFAALSALLAHGRFARCAPHPAICAALAQQDPPCIASLDQNTKTHARTMYRNFGP